jgi:hypothetical protein
LLTNTRHTINVKKLDVLKIILTIPSTGDAVGRISKKKGIIVDRAMIPFFVGKIIGLMR